MRDVQRLCWRESMAGRQADRQGSRQTNRQAGKQAPAAQHSTAQQAPFPTHRGCQPQSSSGRDLRTAARKSPWRFSSWHQFSKYSNKGYSWLSGLRCRCLQGGRSERRGRGARADGDEHKSGVSRASGGVGLGVSSSMHCIQPRQQIPPCALCTSQHHTQLRCAATATALCPRPRPPPAPVDGDVAPVANPLGYEGCVDDELGSEEGVGSVFGEEAQVQCKVEVCGGRGRGRGWGGGAGMSGEQEVSG